MGNKLLHERLREWASNRPFRFNEAWEEFEVAGNDELLAAFADEIERQYVPVPRFPDGEPVHLGCPVCGGVVGGFSVWDDGSFALYSEDGDVLQEGEPGDFAKRPELKALDADGVEVKVGDTVWRITDGLEVVVTGLERVGFVDQKGLCLNPKCYTHREPDSLEKLRDDIAEGLADVAIPANVWDIKRAEWCDRLTALMERGA